MATRNDQRVNKPKYVYSIPGTNLPPEYPLKKVNIPLGWPGGLLNWSKKLEMNVKQDANDLELNKDADVMISRKSVKKIVKSRSSVSQPADVRSAAALLQVKVLVSDMPGWMQLHAFRCARTTYDSLEKFSSKHVAYNIKKEFDKVYGPSWHCIVGSSFGSFVTHSTGCFLYFSMEEKLYILIFKTKAQNALHF